eukprot:gene2994-3267_t
MMMVDEGRELLDDPSANSSNAIDSLLEKCIDSPQDGRDAEMAFCLAMGNAADAVEIICVGFILAEMDNVSSLDQEFLSSAVFLGMLFGGLLGGLGSDLIGRRKALLFALGLSAIAGMLSAASPDITILILIRVFAGLGIGGSVPIVFSLGAEILPSRRRGQWLSFIASFWMVGAIFTAFSAWMILGKDMMGNRIWSGGNWRIFAIISAIPALVAFTLVYYKVPESPRYLLKKGEIAAAASVLNEMSTVDVSESDLMVVTATTNTNPTSSSSLDASSVPCSSAIKLLFSPQLMRTTLILMTIWFSLSFGSYGLSTWITVLFGNVGIGNVYAASFIFALANLPGNLISFFFIDRYGRRVLLGSGMALAGFSALGFALDSHEAVVVVLLASMFNAFSTQGWNALDCLSAELFPTPVRATAMGVLAASGRIGAMAGQFVNGTLQHNIPLLLFVTTSCSLLGGGIAFALPHDSLGPLDEKIVLEEKDVGESGKESEDNKPHSKHMIYSPIQSAEVDP